MAFYDRVEWARARKQALHAANYRCQRCGTSLVGLGRGVHVHHRKELKAAPALRSEPLNLRSLCRSCHTKEHNEARRPPAVNVDGTPNDPNHPWFRTSGGHRETWGRLRGQRRPKSHVHFPHSFKFRKVPKNGTRIGLEQPAIDRGQPCAFLK